MDHKEFLLQGRVTRSRVLAPYSHVLFLVKPLLFSASLWSTEIFRHVAYFPWENLI